MQLLEARHDSFLVLSMHGRLDTTTSSAVSPRLRELMQPPLKAVVLDLERLEYISSAGFRVLLIAGKNAEAIGATVHLCALSPKVQQLFELGGFMDLFPIHASVSEARGALHGAA